MWQGYDGRRDWGHPHAQCQGLNEGRAKNNDGLTPGQGLLPATCAHPQCRVCTLKTCLNLLPKAGPAHLLHRNTRELVGNAGSRHRPRSTEPDP